MSELDYVKRMRLKFNLYASRTAKHRLIEAIKNNDDHEIYSATGELLLWVMNIDLWHRENGSSEYENKRDNIPTGQVVKGLAHAYNSLKHNMDIFTIHRKEGGFSFPLEFPLVIKPISVIWNNAENLLTGGYENQRKNYIKYIQGKEILPTFESALTFLNVESGKVLFNN